MIGALTELLVRKANAPRRRPAAERGHEMLAPERYDSLGALLRDALVQFKTQTALIEVSRKAERRRLTYRDFKEAALRVARRLELAGVGPGSRVAILMSNQSRWLLGAYAALYRGAVLVPLDYKLEAHEQAALLRHAKPAALLVEHSLLRRLEGLELPTLDLIVATEAPQAAGPEAFVRWEEVEQQDGPEPTFEARRRSDLACIVYSSGTGGRPKGCMLTHDAYLEQLRALTARFPIVSGHRYFSILPTNHAIDFMVGFVGPLTGGATIVHQRTLRPELVTWTMRQYRITHMALVPLVLEAFERKIRDELDALDPTRRAVVESLIALNESLTLSSPRPRLSRALLGKVHEAFGGALETVFCGGAFTDPKRAELLYRLGIPVVIGYGLTEACTVATVGDLAPFRADSVGRPVDGVEVRIDEADADGVGEVVLRGRTLMRGYLDEPELTAETLRDGGLHTGDLGWLDASGHLHLVGRAKNMIVTAGGKNVYPEDIEGAFEELPCEELAVFASNYLWPGAALPDELLVAVCRARAQDADELLGALRAANGRLSDHKRVRGLVRFPDEFPRTASMKIKRQELAQAIRARLGRDAIERV